MAAWGVPLLMIGGLGCALYIWLGFKTRCAARTILRLSRR
jgi:uncharacterized membrane protein